MVVWFGAVIALQSLFIYGFTLDSEFGYQPYWLSSFFFVVAAIGFYRQFKTRSGSKLAMSTLIGTFYGQRACL